MLHFIIFNTEPSILLMKELSHAQIGEVSMANIFKQYKDSRTSAGLFTEPGSFPSALQSTATEGPRAGALDLHVSWIPAVASCSRPMNFFFIRRTLLLCDLALIAEIDDFYATANTPNRLMGSIIHQCLTCVRSHCQRVYHRQQTPTLALGTQLFAEKTS